MPHTHSDSRQHHRPEGRFLLACLRAGGVTVALGRDVINASSRPFHDRINAAMHLAESTLVTLDGVNPDPGAAQSVEVPIEGQVVTLELEPASVRTESSASKEEVANSSAKGSVVEPFTTRSETARIATTPIPT